jgi:hypothetical protein
MCELYSGERKMKRPSTMLWVILLMACSLIGCDSKKQVPAPTVAENRRIREHDEDRPLEREHDIRLPERVEEQKIRPEEGLPDDLAESPLKDPPTRWHKRYDDPLVGANIGVLGSAKFILDKDGNPLGGGYHEITYRRDLGYIVGSSGSISYILDRQGRRLSHGYQEFEPDEKGIVGSLGSQKYRVSIKKFEK